MGLLFGSAGAHTYLKSGQVAPPRLILVPKLDQHFIGQPFALLYKYSKTILMCNGQKIQVLDLLTLVIYA